MFEYTLFVFSVRDDIVVILNLNAGGLMYKLGASNLQYVTSITFLLTTYGKYMSASRHTFNCESLYVTANTLKALAKKQASRYLVFISYINLYIYSRKNLQIN